MLSEKKTAQLLRGKHFQGHIRKTDFVLTLHLLGEFSTPLWALGFLNYKMDIIIELPYSTAVKIK